MNKIAKSDYPKIPKNQKIPGNIKVGDIFYRASVYTDEDDKISLDICECVVRSIRRPNRPQWMVYREMKNTMPVRLRLVEKNIVTWGKLSKKRYDYGWLSYIPDIYVHNSNFDDGFMPPGIWKTKLQALKYLLKKSRNTRDFFKGDDEIRTEIDKEISIIKRRITREENKKSKG